MSNNAITLYDKYNLNAIRGKDWKPPSDLRKASWIYCYLNSGLFSLCANDYPPAIVASALQMNKEPKFAFSEDFELVRFDLNLEDVFRFL